MASTHRRRVPTRVFAAAIVAAALAAGCAGNGGMGGRGGVVGTDTGKGALSGGASGALIVLTSAPGPLTGGI
jgi:hypothetical protein